MDEVSVRKQQMGTLPKIIGLVILLVAGGLFVLRNQEMPIEEPSEQPEEVEAAITGVPEGYERRKIDGVPVKKEDLPEHLFGVMIENSAEAWPLSGLSQARLVIEAPVEGSIPRFLAFFDDTQDLEKVGPVRSARPYYVRWAQGFEAMYTHVGGSPEALEILRRLELPQVNEFFWTQFFWRAQDRFAPHNVFTSIDMLKTAVDVRQFEQDEIPSWSYDEVLEKEGQDVSAVTIPFSPISNLYDAKWEFDQEMNAFKRYQGGEVQIDVLEEEVFAKNIVVLFAEVATIDDVGRKSIQTSGEGRALLFRNGKVFETEWKKDSHEDPLNFYFEDDQEAIFYPGTTWIEVIPLSTDIQIDSVE